ARLWHRSHLDAATAAVSCARSSAAPAFPVHGWLLRRCNGRKRARLPEVRDRRSGSPHRATSRLLTMTCWLRLQHDGPHAPATARSRRHGFHYHLKLEFALSSHPDITLADDEIDQADERRSVHH